MNKRFMLVPGGLLLLASCHFDVKVSYNNKELKDYYETEDISEVKEKNNLYIDINNSKLIKKKLHQGSAMVYSLDGFASIGALLASNDPLNQSTDSIIIKLQDEGQKKYFAYNTHHLIKVRQYADICKRFIYLISKNEFDSSRKLLTSEVSSNKNLDYFLNTYLLSTYIIDSKLTSFTINKDFIVLNINISYRDKSIKSFKFNFIVNGDNKIAGIEQA